MKSFARYALALALLVSASSKAYIFSCSTTKKLITVAAIGAAAVTLYTQKAASSQELEKRRSIADEDCLTMCKRFWRETVVGQMKKESKLVRCGENGKMHYDEYPATGLIGTTATVMKDKCLPVLGAVVAVEKTAESVTTGWKKFGLDRVCDISGMLTVPNFAPAQTK